MGQIEQITIYENLMNLALSTDKSNHEIFHLYSNLEEKLDAFDWFWNNKLDELPLYRVTPYMETKLLFFNSIILFSSNRLELWNFYHKSRILVNTTLSFIKDHLISEIILKHHNV